MNRVLVLFAHPVFQTSLLNRTLIEALPDNSRITFHDLYETYPNFMIDVDHEQQLLRDHEVIIFQHPMYWYSCPALLKEWMDLVLEHGFAYGTNGTALNGKKLLSVITSGADVENYQGMQNVRALLRPFELTAQMCNMTYLPPFITYGGLKIKADQSDGSSENNTLQHQAQRYHHLVSEIISGHFTPPPHEYETMNEWFRQREGES